jgi:hypothetical protein
MPVRADCSSEYRLISVAIAELSFHISRTGLVELYRQMLREGRQAPHIIVAPYTQHMRGDPLRRWYVVDGNHRVAAAALEGRARIYALVEFVRPLVHPAYLVA